MLAEASLLVALTVQHGNGAEGCLDAPRLKRSVERRLKRRVFVDTDHADLRFVVTFEKHGDELEARIDVSSSDGTSRGSRSLVTANHCSALDDSLALSVALLVDQPPDPEPPAPPVDETKPAKAGTGAPAPTPTPPKARPTPITIPDDVAAPREPLHVMLGASAEAAWGLLPGITPAVTLYLKLVPSQFLPITLQGEGFLPASAERNSDSGAHFYLFRAGLSLCPTLSSNAARVLGLCFGQKLGFIEVEGFGFDHDRQERRLTYALTAGGEGRLRLFAPVSVRAYLGGEVPVVRDRFSSGGRNASNLFETSPVAVAAEIGLEAALR
ncbi:MAG TPA: hypothetical protein VHB79_01590 [Polyangiaceae bacterium]|nr:hypothetical protein [Polyangiaceae bacterium]